MSYQYYIPFVVVVFYGCMNNQPKDGKDAYRPQEFGVFIGTYTKDSSNGIYEMNFDAKGGMLSEPELIATAKNPSFLAWNQTQNTLYAVNEIDEGGVSAFQFDSESNQFSLVKHIPSEGSAPCHVSISHSGKLLSSSNYSTGNVICYPLLADGSLSDDVTFMQNIGEPGPTSRQKTAHAHCGMFSRNDQFLHVVDLGLDKIISYPLNEKGFTGDPFTGMSLDPGDGPRHLIFHPTKDLAFVINELSSTIVSMSVNATEGTFMRIDKKSTIPADFDGENYCADLHLSSDGRFLYGSNRGHNSIAVFEIKEDGQLQFLQTEPTQGEWPRNFAISPDDKFLLVANQNTNNVTVFDRSFQTGLLNYTGNQMKVFSPVCLIFR